MNDLENPTDFPFAEYLDLDLFYDIDTSKFNGNELMVWNILDDDSLETSTKIPQKRKSLEPHHTIPPKRVKTSVPPLRNTGVIQPTKALSLPSNNIGVTPNTELDKAPVHRAKHSNCKTTNNPLKRGAPASERETPGKRAKTTAKPTNVKAPRNKVFTFGTGDCGELGQGEAEKIIKRPRLMQFFEINKISITDIAGGGTHFLALTEQGLVYSWGVNDRGTLGRDTHFVEESLGIEENDIDDAPMNPRESTPGLVEGFPKGTKIIRISASDSCSFFVTSDGLLYGCGVFRCSDGEIGFTKTSKQVSFPELIRFQGRVIDIATGNNHAIVLLDDGSVHTFGNGENYQLGRRINERTRTNGLVPESIYRGLARRKRKRATAVYAGGNHSFVVTEDGSILACGLNNYGQCGTDNKETIIQELTIVEGLRGLDISMITAGEHHSIAITRDGSLIMWGCCDSGQVGNVSAIAEDCVRYIGKKPASIAISQHALHEGFNFICSGTEHNLGIKSDGRVWLWGSGISYQIGQGPDGGEELDTPKPIENSAIKNMYIISAAACGNSSALLGTPRQE